jgi:gliding motility associated protien GldN
MKILKITLILCFTVTALFAQKKKAPAKKKPVAKPVAASVATPSTKVDSVYYWVSYDGRSTDPTNKYTLAKLTDQINQGKVMSSTLVVSTGAKEWKTAAEFSELAPLIKAAAPPLVQKAYVPPALPIDSLQKKQVKDGIQANQETKKRSLEPYADVRPQDVLYSKRLWRNVDFGEKLNQPFVAQESNFATVIYKLLEAGRIVAYSKDDFTSPISTQDALDAFKDAEKQNNKSDSIPGPDGKMIPRPKNKFRSGNSLSLNTALSAIQIKEDWIFDKIRQELEPRIVGIALIKKDEETKKNDQKSQAAQAMGMSIAPDPNQQTFPTERKNSEVMFWLNFDQIRPFLHEAIVINNYNDASPLSFDDLLVKRIFASYIVKESGTKNTYIDSNPKLTPQDRLRESERIKKALMDWEHDLWSY